MDKIVELVFYSARKATAAFVLAAGGAIGTSMLDGVLTREELVVALGVGLVAAAGVYATPKNKPGI